MAAAPATAAAAKQAPQLGHGCHRLTDGQRVPLDDAEVTKMVTPRPCIICGHGV